jgi:hypothetical protein
MLTTVPRKFCLVELEILMQCKSYILTKSNMQKKSENKKGLLFTEQPSIFLSYLGYARYDKKTRQLKRQIIIHSAACCIREYGA